MCSGQWSEVRGVGVQGSGCWGAVSVQLTITRVLPDFIYLLVLALVIGMLLVFGVALAVVTRKPAAPNGSPRCMCGYDLRGNVSGRCPECGRDTPADKGVRPRRRKRELVASLVMAGVSVAAGAGIWLTICAVTGVNEAWDAGMYWYAGVPAMVGAAGVLGFVRRRHAWRWPVLIIAAQAGIMYAPDAGRALHPLAIVGALFLGVILIACVAGAYAGAGLRDLADGG